MVNAAHWHLLVNHFPIVGAILAVPVALLALILRKERGLLLAAVFLLAATAVTAWISVETGENAQDWIESAEDKPWFRAYEEANVGEHEERAETAAVVSYVSAAVGLFVLWLARRRTAENPLPRFWILLVVAGAAATSGAMGWAGNAGGVIMHREIRGDALDTTKPAAADRGK